MSREMAHKVILPPKKNYIPQFLKQRDINSYIVPAVQATQAGLNGSLESILGILKSLQIRALYAFSSTAGVRS